jgi:hypothetical protein
MSLSLLDHDRWQGSPPWSAGQHCCEAVAQWPEDRSCAMRGPEHLWRVLPCEAYVLHLFPAMVLFWRMRNWMARVGVIGYNY